MDSTNEDGFVKVVAKQRKPKTQKKFERSQKESKKEEVQAPPPSTTPTPQPDSAVQAAAPATKKPQGTSPAKVCWIVYFLLRLISQIVQVQTRSENLMNKSPRRKATLDPESFPSLTPAASAKQTESVWSKGVASIIPKESLSASPSTDTLNQNDIPHLDEEEHAAPVLSSATTVVDDADDKPNKQHTDRPHTSYRARPQNGYNRRGGRRFDNHSHHSYPIAKSSSAEGQDQQQQPHRRTSRGRNPHYGKSHYQNYYMDQESLKYYLRVQM